ncbi:MAG: ABC transporter substrate-binding protein, partial [Candidatus Limnocylindrales bacterium]
MRDRRSLGLVVIASLLFAACSATASPTVVPSVAVPPASSAPATSSAPAASPSPSGAPFAGQSVSVAKTGPAGFDDVAIGYWVQLLKTKLGLNVQYNEPATDDVTLRAVVSGSANVGVAVAPNGVVSLAQVSTTPVKFLVADSYASDYVLLSKSSITAVSDLAGKTMGISAPGDAGELTARLCLKDSGFDVSKVKEVRIGGTSARVAALLAGQIDVGPAHIADALAGIEKSAGSLHI